MRPIAIPLPLLRAAVRLGDAVGQEAVESFAVKMEGIAEGVAIVAAAGEDLGVFVCFADSTGEAHEAVDVALQRAHSKLPWRTDGE